MRSNRIGNIREGYKPCKKRYIKLDGSLLTRELLCILFYRAPARDEGSSASELRMANEPWGRGVGVILAGEVSSIEHNERKGCAADGD